MKDSNRIGLIMFGRPQFDMPLAQCLFQRVATSLVETGINLEVVDDPVTTAGEAVKAALMLKGKDLDAVVVVQGTFTDASLVLHLAHTLDLPLLLWAFQDKPTGERLRLNSLCGINLGAHALKAAGKNFKAVYGDPDSRRALEEVTAYVRAAGARKWLKGRRLGLIGRRPQGFYASNFNEISLYSRLGVAVEYISLDEVFNLASKINADDSHLLLQDVKGYDKLDSQGVERSVRGYLALKEIVTRKSLDGIALECWPDFMAYYGGAACFALSKLNDEGIVAACEADVNGAVSMLLGQYFSGKPTFLADLVVGDEEKNELIFWHCGAAPQSLASPTAPVVAGVHPNRKIPLALYFPLQGETVTIMRLSPGPDNSLRLLLGRGAGLQAPLLFSGNTLPVRMEKPVNDIIAAILAEGFEHHYVIVYGDLAKELRDFSALLGLEIVEI